MGRASRNKWERRIERLNAKAIAEQNAKKGQPLTRGTIFLATSILTILLGLVLAPTLAKILSRKETVALSYRVMPVAGACNFYVIGLHPVNPRDEIKSFTLDLQFPGEIRSLEYGTDRLQSDKLILQDGYDFEAPCDVKAPAASDLPSNVQISRMGQSHRELLVRGQDFSRSTSLMIVVGADRSPTVNIDYSGRAVYSAWGQDIEAPIEFEGNGIVKF